MSRSPSSLLDAVDWPVAPPAAAWSLFSRGATLRSGVSGLRHADGTAAAELDDLWHFGSAGKAMTASMVAALVRLGTLQWSDRVADHLLEAAGTAYEAVTVQDLLAHRSGLPTDPARWPLLRYLLVGGDPTEVSDRLTRRALAQPPAFAAGSDFLYSNVGYGLAGAIAARASGRPFDELIVEHVFTPFGLGTARFGLPPQDGSAPREHTLRGNARNARARTAARPWKVVRHGERAVDDLPLIRPSGCVSGQVADLAAFARRHLAALHRGDDADALATIHRPIGPPPDPPSRWRYAMGWFVDRSCDGSRRLWHTGSTGGSFALMMLLPDVDLGLAVVANGFDPSWALPDSTVLESINRSALRPELSAPC